MRIPEKDTALLCKIHIGLTRTGQAFLETEKVENVLGDIDHKSCIEDMAAFVASLLETMLTLHLGAGGLETTPERLKEIIDSVKTDDLTSFFDAHNTIADE